MNTKIFSIAKYTFKENVRNKVFYITILFAVILLLSSLLFGTLGGEQELRLLHDFGVITTEFFSLLTAIYLGITIILEEINLRTIYLILSRSIHRSTYILGRYLGIMYTIFTAALIMTILHFVLLIVKGWEIELMFGLSFVGLILKIMIILAIAIFFALFSSSAVSSLSFTFLLWILGHFAQELNFLIKKMTGLLPKLLLKLVYYITPNFQYFNFRDNIILTTNLSLGYFINAVLYAIVYTIICLLLSLLLFSRKEF